MQAGQTQMNIRIDAALKNRGDAVLAEYGFTPSHAVRALWAHLSQHKTPPEFMIDDARTDGNGKPFADRAEEGAGMAVRLATQAGLHCASLQELPYDELRERAFQERLIEDRRRLV